MHYGRAVHHFTTALQLATTAGDTYLQSAALTYSGRVDTAGREMAHARQLWSPTRTDRFGDLDRPAALLALRQGKLDTAEPLAAASLRRWESISPVDHAQSSIVLATIYVQAGEHDSLPMAYHAITAVSRLGSARARRRLQPLASALETRPGRDTHDLARIAQQTIFPRA